MLRGGVGGKRAAKAAGIAELVTANGEHVGMGIIVDRRHVLTCAHVVNAARGRLADEVTGPRQDKEHKRVRQDDPVEIRFPMLPVGQCRKGEVIAWRDVGLTPLDDIAVLELDDDAPAEAGEALLADISSQSLDGDRLSVFGIAPERRIGNHVDARFMGQNTDAWIQIESSEKAHDFIDGGYSGGAVWDNVHEAVVGMIVRKFRSDAERIAYMIPIADLAAFWPELPHEKRPLSPSFMRSWTTLSVVFFLLLLAHWQAERGTEIFQPVTLGGPARLLNAFWGMHIFAFLAPVVFYMFLVFARSRRLHPWWARVPSFGSLSAIPVSSTMRRTAALTLAAFVVLPLAAQGHFIRKFHKEGYVYVYCDIFGYKPQDLGGCSKGPKRVCRAPNSNYMRLVEPINGAPGGYWDNAYHYGAYEAESGQTVTFFPILQPLAVYGLTALSILIAGLLGYTIFVKPDEPAGSANRGRRNHRPGTSTKNPPNQVGSLVQGSQTPASG